MMRATIIAFLLATAYRANAEPPSATEPLWTDVRDVRMPGRPVTTSSWWDFGLLSIRTDPGDQTLVSGTVVRFGPRLAVGRHFYFGAELDAGSLGGVPQTGSIARSTGTMPSTSVDGKFASIKSVVGLRAIVGAISGGGELAAGLRTATIWDQVGNQVADSGVQPVIEGRGRLDLWITPNVTLGGTAGVNLLARDQVSIGLVVGLHFGRYDNVRR